MAPSEGRKNPRHILSFESLTNRSNVNQGSSRAPPQKSSALQNIGEEEGIGRNSNTSVDNWTGEELVESPRATGERALDPGQDRRTRSQKPAPLTFNRSTTPDSISLASPSRARWEHLRQHVLPIPLRSNSPRPSQPQPQLPPVGATQTLPPPRAPTPKPSRLAARFGFRQVVEHAREVTLDDTRKFAHELEKICWSIRSTEPQKVKIDREPVTMGSSLHLPFMSSTSIATTGSTDNVSLGNQKKHEIRRPHSVQSLTAAFRSVPSLKPLYQTLLQHATPSADGIPLAPNLPLESLVLSTLLSPFLISQEGSRLDEERWSAIESFEIITRTWPPRDEVLGVERYLWCCKAALIPPSTMRTRVLGILWGLLIPTETVYSITSPECFRTLAQGLFSFLPSLRPLSTSVSDQEETMLLNDMIVKVGSGCCGELDTNLICTEYNSVLSAKDDANLIRGAILLEALSRCLDECTDESRLWLLHNALEQYWTKHLKDIDLTPVLAAIHTRVINNLSRAILRLLSIPLDQAAYILRARCVARLLQTRIIPDMDALDKGAVTESGINIVNIVIELICMDRAKEPTRWGLSLLCAWYRETSFWKSCSEKALQELVSDNNWSNILFKLSSLVKLLPDETRKPILAFILPHLYDRLVEAPPTYPCISLTNLLDTISRLYPQIFYKPLFSCAASSKEYTVVNHLCTMLIVSKFLPDFWIRDAEMVSVALMSDGGKKEAPSETSDKSWTKAKLGQSVLFLELIGCIQTARHEKEASSHSEGSFIETAKFAISLELRLGILLEAKEKFSLIPPSRRLLFCILLREIRLLTRSLKPAPWLSRVVDWFLDLHSDDVYSEDLEVEEKSAIGQIQGLYAAAHDGVRSAHQRRSTMVLSRTPEKFQDAPVEKTAALAVMLGRKETLISSLSKGFVAKAMKLFVTMSTLLNSKDYSRLGPLLWDYIQNGDDASQTASVCFLVMQCAEKVPRDLLATIEVDLQSSDDNIKMKAMQKISILFNWRFQILSQHVVADRARRPFKVARGPLPFVATDIGSNVYIHEDDPDELTDSLPSELRKRLAEIGWDQDNKPVDQQREWIKTPMSLLPTNQLNYLDNIVPDPPPLSPSLQTTNILTSLSSDKSIETGLLRRNSSTGGPQYGSKRRAVFVPSLAHIFPRLASLVFDSNLMVSFTARHTLLDLMRNDPALLARPILDLFTGDQKDMHSAILTIRAFLHVQGNLPPPMTHHIFNNIAGFLKYAARNAEDGSTVEDFARLIPILARLITQVTGMSIREIRRAKVETFLIPSGSLWFPSSAPPGPMFPKGPASLTDPFNILPSDLLSITMIRISQNVLLLSMLKRHRQDVQLVRKNMSRLDLPSLNPSHPSPLGLHDFVPQKLRKGDENSSLKGPSLILSRSYLLLVAQIFRSMSRHLNDRNELAILIDGLNRILLAHGDDISIVSQALIALMVASTRFRRLFTSGGSYALFMPAVIKIYIESESHSGIKLAIEYAVNRFYALHQEAFVFQTLDILAHITSLPNIDIDWFVKGIYNLFFTLRRGVPPSTPDAAGIHNANKVQEREALIVSTAEEKPQTFLSLLHRRDSKVDVDVTINLPEEYESGRLGMDNFVRLFLTVIAHDPSIVRAEQFLRLLRVMTPYLYHATSSARSVLQEGIDALGVVLIRASPKPKGNDGPGQNEDIDLSSSEVLLENVLLEKSRSPSNPISMKGDYLSLIIGFTRAGGQLSHLATLRALDLVKLMLKDCPGDINGVIGTFLADLIRTSLLRDSPPSVKMVISFLQDLSPLISTYATVVDFSGVFESITELAANPLYANEPLFSRVVVAQICAPGLAVCEAAALAQNLLSFPCRLSIVSLLTQAVFLRGADVMGELEKRTASYDFLAGVMLPLAMSLKTELQLESSSTWVETWHRTALENVWARLLSYTMSACKARRPLERARSQDRNRSPDPKRAKLPAFMMALQILKVITIRAESVLTSRIPGIWPRLAGFLIDALREGSASFASNSSDSPLHSPIPSPRTSGYFDEFHSSISTDFRNPPQNRTFSSPRIIDYTLWSFLELLCAYRNPLVLQMRLFMIEKIVDLDHNRQSLLSPNPRNRRVSSVFSKPRRRSGMPSPNSSPRPSPHSLHSDVSFSPDSGRQAGYMNTSSPHDKPGPKIVHLGPISAISAFGRALSPGRGGKGLDIMVKTTKIKSLTLVRATYRRIQRVQNFLGYEPIPTPSNHEADGSKEPVTTWTKKQALDTIAKETQQLLEEFEESDRSLQDDPVWVESSQFGPY